MGKIVFIAPEERTAAVVNETARRLGLSVSTKLGSGDERRQLILEACREGADVIVSRWGASLATMESISDAPLVNVEITGYDMARALVQAREIGKEIGLLAREKMVKSGTTMATLLGIRLKKVVTLNSYDPSELEDGLRQMKAAGVEILLGGTRVTSLAPRFGMQGLFVVAGEEAITDALVEANRIIPVKQKEREKTEQVKAILDSAHDGVIAVDRDRRVTVFNRMAAEISGLKPEMVIGRPVSQVLPGIGFEEVLTSGEPEVGTVEKLGPSYVVLSRVPVVVNDEVVGAVATFVDVSRIQRMEENVRKHLAARGMVAKFRFEDIVGVSAKIKSTIDIARKYALVDAAVLITGETGVGKEMFAQAIHNASSRRNGPFVAINCGALPESVLESELFGYVEGAFTGARKGGKAGLFELAHRGTVFLDEVSEMPVRIQTRFLRVLQEREVIRLGDEKVVPVDIRVIAATNRSLDECVRAGLFREDLYYRLNVLNLRIPPLRERREDIMPLFDHFVRQFEARFGKTLGHVLPETRRWLMSYEWPGNVRELENIAQRLVVCSGMQEDAVLGQVVQVTGEGSAAEQARSARGAVADGSSRPTAGRIEDAEWEAIVRALRETRGNKAEAARVLGISTTTLWRRLRARGWKGGVNLADLDGPSTEWPGGRRVSRRAFQPYAAGLKPDGCDSRTTGPSK